MTEHSDQGPGTTSAGKRTRSSSPSASAEKLSTPKKAALGPVRNLLEDWSSDEEAPADAAPRLQEDGAEENDMDSSPPDLSIATEEDVEQQQQQDDDSGEWHTVRRGQARHQQPQRPRFKLGSLGDHGSAYQAITALEKEHPTLRMEVRPNLQGDYVLTPKDEVSAALLRRLAEEGNKVLLLDPSVRRHKVVLERYPLDLPLDAVKAHPQVASAQRLCSWRTKEPTRQVLVVLVGPPPAKLDLGCWGKYHLRPYQGEPVRCFKCHRYNHLGARCEHAVRCGVCSQPHPTEECIERHKASEATTAKCPNCGKSHHAWNPRCPERLRRLPRPYRRQQQHSEAPPKRRRQRRRRAPRGRPRQEPSQQRQQQQQQQPHTDTPPGQAQQQEPLRQQQQPRTDAPSGQAWQQAPQPQQQQPRKGAPPGQTRQQASQRRQQQHQPKPEDPRGLEQRQQQQQRHQLPPRGQHQPQQAPTTAPPPSKSAWSQRPGPMSISSSPRPAARPEGGMSKVTGSPATPQHQPKQGGAGPRLPGSGAQDQGPAIGAPATTSQAPTTAGRRAMTPSDPLHGEPVSLSEETRAVVTAIMARMAQLLANILASPGSAPARQEDLEALLRQETVTAISECGLQPPPHTSRDPRLRALHPADPCHHQDGESLC